MRPEFDATRPSRRIRILIADDEPLARDLMSSLVRRDTDLELIGSAASGSEALKAVEEFAPEILLLDIQMPNLDGISVAEQLAGKDPTPYIIFVTAHDSFAIQAFQVAVRDYLVKPVSKKRFSAAIRRAKDEIFRRDRLESVRTEDALVVRNGESVVSLLPADIVWVEAANQYVRLHTVDTAEYIVSQSLRQFGHGLPDKLFTRIHRARLINNRHLVGLLSSDGRYRAQMSDGSVHDIARNRRALVPGLLAAARSNSNR